VTGANTAGVTKAQRFFDRIYRINRIGKKNSDNFVNPVHRLCAFYTVRDLMPAVSTTGTAIKTAAVMSATVKSAIC